MRYDILQWTRWTDNERSLQQRLAAAEAMLDLSERVGEERHDLNAKLAFASEFARSTKLFRSIVLLCQVGCGQPALALASDLFESSMAAVWASTRSDVADEQAELHARFGRLLLDRTAVQFPYWNRQPEAMSAEDLAAAMSLFGEECSRLWTGHADVAALVDDLTSDFDDWHLAEKWNALANFSYRWAGNMHRPTGQAIESHWESIEPSTLELLTGPAEAFVMDALNFASMTYIWLVQVAVDEFRPDLLPRLKDVEGLGWRAWKNPAELLHRGDDDPCPCDRPGARWVDCHKWTEALGTVQPSVAEVPGGVELAADTVSQPSSADVARDPDWPPQVELGLGPRLLTFTFTVPFPIGLVDYGVHRMSVPSEFADPNDIAHFGDQPFVDIRMWNAPTAGVAIWPTRLEDSLAQFYNYPPRDIEVPLWGAGNHYEQWVTLETPGARLVGEEPEDEAFAFHRSLDALNQLLESCGIAYAESDARAVTTNDLGAILALGHRTSGERWEYDGYLLMHPESFPANIVAPWEPDAAICHALDALRSGQPFLNTNRWAKRARRALIYRGDLSDCVVSFQTAAETMVYDLWRMLLVDRNMTSTQIRDETEGETPFKSVLATKLPVLLGGSWNPFRTKSEVGRYWNDLYQLRNRVVHAGHEPSRREAEKSMQAFDELQDFVATRLQRRQSEYPRTLVAKLGGGGLQRRGWLTPRLLATVEALAAEPLPFHWPADLAGRPTPTSR